MTKRSEANPQRPPDQTRKRRHFLPTRLHAAPFPNANDRRRRHVRRRRVLHQMVPDRDACRVELVPVPVPLVVMIISCAPQVARRRSSRDYVLQARVTQLHVVVVV
ncbi:unnamed protein product, partial [Linum tenue]